MPQRDRTGPTGEGPMTGWGAGDCASQPAWGRAGPMPSRRAGGRGGRGRRPRSGGRQGRHRFYAAGLPTAWEPPTQEQEISTLKAQAEQLRKELDAINQRLEELDNIA